MELPMKCKDCETVFYLSAISNPFECPTCYSPDYFEIEISKEKSNEKSR